jgi:hypothetical protein
VPTVDTVYLGYHQKSSYNAVGEKTVPIPELNSYPYSRIDDLLSQVAQCSLPDYSMGDVLMLVRVGCESCRWRRKWADNTRNSTLYRGIRFLPLTFESSVAGALRTTWLTESMIRPASPTAFHGLFAPGTDRLSLMGLCPHVRRSPM